MGMLTVVFTCIIAFLAGIFVGAKRCPKLASALEENAKLKVEIQAFKTDAFKYKKIAEGVSERYDRIRRKHNKLVDILSDIMSRKKPAQ